jgi:diadenosine tetraphosphatase ApaH/serine/threonine PP2A family protein phosphatase
LSLIGVVADIHANLAAFEAVVSHATDIEAWWCLGDIVGYGPSPQECLLRVESVKASAIVGNHDLGAIGKISLMRFNRDARLANQWTSSTLGPADVSRISGLPDMKVEAQGDSLLVHGSPRDPVWEYLRGADAAYWNFKSFDNRLAFCGHTHIPALFRWSTDAGQSADSPVVRSHEIEPDEPIELEEGSRYIINAGSVGQPRDGDARACYVAYDPERSVVTYRRVPYDVGTTQRAMALAGLPEFLARRLGLGI